MAKKTKDSNLSLEERLEQALIPNWDEPYKLPENWCWTQWGNCGQFIAGGAFKEKYQGFLGLPIPFYKVGSLKYSDNNGYLYDETNTIDEDIRNKLKVSLIPVNSIIFAKIGEAIRLNRRSLNTSPCCIDNNLMAFVASNECYYKYVYYWSKSINLYEYANATTVPAIRKTDLESIAFPLAPYETQIKIVNHIESLFAKLEEAKEKAQEVVDGFETRKSAILHKAFSGELTAKWREKNDVSIDSWASVSISDVCTVNPKKIDIRNISDELQVSFFPMPALSEVYGAITEPQTRLLKEVKTGFTNFVEGDVVFAKITPCMENGKSAVIGKLVNDIGYGTTEFYVLRCGEKAFNRYIYHLLRSKTFRDQAKQVMTGAVGQQRVPKSFIEHYMLLLPSISEQKEIVSILDRMYDSELKAIETAEAVIKQIDTMKKAILARAFRGELGTNDPSEESAVELLKQVLSTASEPTKPVRRTVIPKSLESRIKTDLERKIIKLYIQNEVNVLTIDLIMSVSSKKFDIMEALRNLQQRGILEKENDKYKLLG